MDRAQSYLWVLESMHLRHKKWRPRPYGRVYDTREEARSVKKQLESSVDIGWRYRVVKYEAKYE